MWLPAVTPSWCQKKKVRRKEESAKLSLLSLFPQPLPSAQLHHALPNVSLWEQAGQVTILSHSGPRGTVGTQETGMKGALATPIIKKHRPQGPSTRPVIPPFHPQPHPGFPRSQNSPGQLTQGFRFRHTPEILA